MNKSLIVLLFVIKAFYLYAQENKRGINGGVGTRAMVLNNAGIVNTLQYNQTFYRHQIQVGTLTMAYSNRNVISVYGADIKYQFHPNKNKPKFDLFFYFESSYFNARNYTIFMNTGGYGFDVSFGKQMKWYLTHSLGLGRYSSNGAGSSEVALNLSLGLGYNGLFKVNKFPKDSGSINYLPMDTVEKLNDNHRLKNNFLMDIAPVFQNIPSVNVMYRRWQQDIAFRINISAWYNKYHNINTDIHRMDLAMRIGVEKNIWFNNFSLFFGIDEYSELKLTRNLPLAQTSYYYVTTQSIYYGAIPFSGVKFIPHEHFSIEAETGMKIYYGENNTTYSNSGNKNYDFTIDGVYAIRIGYWF